VASLRPIALAGALRPLFPEWAVGLPPALEPAEDATAARHRVFCALAEILARLEVSVLVVEDAHWADEATLEFLLFVASCHRCGRRPRRAAPGRHPVPRSSRMRCRRAASDPRSLRRGRWPGSGAAAASAPRRWPGRSAARARRGTARATEHGVADLISLFCEVLAVRLGCSRSGTRPTWLARMPST
jgi:hypothetical protein